MPARPTKATTAVNIELPTALVERLRDFAKRDMRSLKAEFIRAIRLLLDTCDRPGAALAEPAVMSGTPSADTQMGDTLRESIPQTTPPEPDFHIAGMSDVAFARFLEKVAKKEHPLSEIALARRDRRTIEQISSEFRTLKPHNVRAVVEKLEKAALKEVKK